MEDRRLLTANQTGLLAEPQIGIRDDGHSQDPSRLVEERARFAAAAGDVEGAATIPTSRWLVQLREKAMLPLLRSRLALPTEAISAVELLPRAYLLDMSQAVAKSRPGAEARSTSEQISQRLAANPFVEFFQQLVRRQYSKRLIPNDPWFGQQWQLRNTGQTGGAPGHDAQVTEVWDQFTGAGVVIGMVDDGLQYTHPDLADNYLASASYDFNDHDWDPAPSSGFDAHGTAAAGVAAAVFNNGLGVAGAAPGASLAGLRLVSSFPDDAEEAAALSHLPQTIDIYNNSWGPRDDGFSLQGPGPLALAALRQGVTDGRGGLGSIYVWAAGNGRHVQDNCNFDGYASSRYTIAVTAITHLGVQADYAEPCAATLVAGYADNPGIVTTDLLGFDGWDEGDYTTTFGGTSAAAPLVSGVLALVLEANPALSWRDVQHVLVNSAAKNDPADSEWTVNGAGHDVNHKYGFGAIDAAAAVATALAWSPVSAEVSIDSGPLLVDAPIPDNQASGLDLQVAITDALRVESVEVTIDATHPSRGGLELILTSPQGTKSVLAQPRPNDTNADLNGWTFTSLRHWDESAYGDWVLTVRDLSAGAAGRLDSWSLAIHGSELPDQPRILAVEVNADLQDPADLPLGPQPTSWRTQHSHIENLRVQFSQAVLVQAEDLRLTNLGVHSDQEPDVVIPLSADQLSLVENVLTISFDAYLLPDGVYALEILPTVTGLQGEALDGNGDGVSGDSFRLTGGSANGFFKLTADFNGDLGTSIFDFSSLAYWFGKPLTVAPSYMDINGDGGVSVFDFPAFAANYGTNLAFPASLRWTAQFCSFPADRAACFGLGQRPVVDSVHASTGESSLVMAEEVGEPRIHRLEAASGSLGAVRRQDASLLQLLAEWDEEEAFFPAMDFPPSTISCPEQDVRFRLFRPDARGRMAGWWVGVQDRPANSCSVT